MPFEFPNTPIAGDTHTEFGVDYVYDGQVWNLGGGGAMTDYVLKAGDTMTGRLDINTGISIGLRLCSTAGVPTMLLSASSSTHTGIIEFFDPNGTTRRGYIGYGSGTWLDIVAENGAGWKFANQLTVDNGIKFANFAQPAGSEHVLTRHLDLYGGTFGLSISSGTLNHVASTNHVFRAGATAIMTMASAAITMHSPVNANGAINCYERLRMMTGEEIWLDNAKIRVPEGSRVEFHDANNYICSTNNNRILHRSNDRHTFHISNVEKFFVDSNGYHGTAAAFAASFQTNDGFDLVAELKGALAEIRALKDEIAQLKAQPRGRR